MILSLFSQKNWIITGDDYTHACKKSGNVSKRWTPYEDKKRVSGEYNTWILIKHVDSTHDSDLLILHSEVTGNYSKPMTTLEESFERPTIYTKEFKCFVQSIMRIVNFSFLVKQFSYENFAFSLTIFIKRDIPLLYTLFKKKKNIATF